MDVLWCIDTWIDPQTNRWTSWFWSRGCYWQLEACNPHCLFKTLNLASFERTGLEETRMSWLNKHAFLWMENHFKANFMIPKSKPLGKLPGSPNPECIFVSVVEVFILSVVTRQPCHCCRQLSQSSPSAWGSKYRIWCNMREFVCYHMLSVVISYALFEHWNKVKGLEQTCSSPPPPPPPPWCSTKLIKKKQALGLATKHDSASRLAKQNFKHT